MILHKLIFRYLKYGDDEGFYLIQARDAVRWLERVGIGLGSDVSALDLGCGRGMIGAELMKRGCRVTFADESNSLLPEYQEFDFRLIDINKDDLGGLGTYDLVICSNVLEHIPRPLRLLESANLVLKPEGLLYLSWTNWLSPWGGHEFAPLHYLGPRRGQALYDRLVGKPREHTVFEDLFPISVGGTIGAIKGNPSLRVEWIVPRYYPEFAFIVRVPVLREFLTWNCALLAKRVC